MMGEEDKEVNGEGMKEEGVKGVGDWILFS